MTEQSEQLEYYNRLLDYDDEEYPIYYCIYSDKRKHLNNLVSSLPDYVI